jgi:hypothetical protein
MWRRRYLWVIIVAQFVVDVGTVIVSFAQCQPISDFWERGAAGNCWSPFIQQYTGYFQGCEYAPGDCAGDAYSDNIEQRCAH